MTTVLAAFIPIVGSVIVAALTYLFAKKKEREAEIRREKLEHDKAFAVSLSGVLAGESTDEGQISFATASNNLDLIASQEVLQKLQAFQAEIKITNPSPERGKHDKLMSELFLAMRKDLNVSPEDDPATFTVGLWAAGVKPAKPWGRS